MKPLTILLALVIGPSFSWAVAIDTLPYTITKSGSYTLGKDLAASATITVPNAITITANDVTLDLEGNTLSGPALDKTGQATTGISVTGTENVIIENGTVRGFGTGIATAATYGRIDTVEVEGFETQGILAAGNYGSVTGCTVLGNGNAGIFVEGSMVSVTNNQVQTNNTGILVENGAIGQQPACVISNNTVVVSAGTGYGIELGIGPIGAFVLSNEVLGGDFGVYFQGLGGAIGVYANNTVFGATTSYQGGTDGGGNK